MGLIEDPDLIKIRHAEEKKKYSKITPAVEIYLLALRADNHQQPLYEYKTQLMDDLGKYLTMTTIHNFCLERYDQQRVPMFAQFGTAGQVLTRQRSQVPRVYGQAGHAIEPPQVPLH
jgi:hypothetical protein